MKKTMIALGLLMVMLLSFTYAYAQGPGFGPGHRGMHPQESWGPGKDNPLTPEQKIQFRELRRKFRQENAQLIGALVTKRLELQSLWTDPKADPKAILDKEKELRDLQNQMRDKIVQSKLEARKLLTPEQIANWKLGWGMGRGHMMRRGGMMAPGGMMGFGQGMGPGHGMGPGYGMGN
jgi:Spy/CpxP family protein refolding chaperone